MRIQKKFFILSFFLFTQSMYTTPLKEQLDQIGYVEMCDNNHGIATYDSLYACF